MSTEINEIETTDAKTESFTLSLFSFSSSEAFNFVPGAQVIFIIKQSADRRDRRGGEERRAEGGDEGDEEEEEVATHVGLACFFFQL